MTKIIKFIFPILFLGLLVNTANFTYAQIKVDQNEEVEQINKDIQDKKDRIKKIQDQQAVYEGLIKQKQGEKANLNNQLAILENRLAKAALDIESAQTEIDRTSLEIDKINLEIKDKDKQILSQKEHIASVVRLMQQQDDKSTLEILLLNGTLNDFVSQVKYLEDINKEISQSLDTLKQYKKDLEGQQKNLNGKKRELSGLKVELEGKKVDLVSEQQNKVYILDQTKYSEREYQRLLKLAKREQQQAESDIVSLEKIVRAKLSKIAGKKLEFNDAGFIWPVPKNTITAYFHDPDYPFRYIFEHPAIDIRAGQGSTLRAVASGYVAIAKNAGKGYSYIMIVHGNGFATVYGHVSKIYVQTDEYVVQGQAIGLTGGMPGTNGAGSLTTGPHLHFEVRLNGVPVNPLEYLP
ncbi:peptidoglycan DD-metalloendopeptidase family protein [Patescibacteria group bacterium]|nr:peptidoglycan DD-metalloendopeptidase family protein [Patescibacteria group bacterium]MBU1663425.1 peptidoglycan DD-metalloendopeptidase family protein [Patescibacteria group bacterium]MBU1933994.1 peptidoglycan DD-metalloendopeptidase family protein [Patescibacteria group bacterium]MBU2007510.1 peptidoglycan DD-metalloendopeptidase family protein [Patescibacteria group bacterium]MBU2233828.1 peptidoglycan DD-metalloendopeptidase family protein [Patescibacteria group bacterium]